MNAKELVKQMTLEEKASLCSGYDFWQLKSIERLGLVPVMITDGPHGLRKQAGKTDHLGLNMSVPATCFPAACATACSFDPALLEEIGRALGEECLQEGVSVILGPGVNIKRSPLCGRNFEYFSEDPLLAGELAAAYIRGVQETGAGTSLKHYAANNQETRRMTINVVVDERTLRELYLRPFEIAVKKSKPWTLMCSYNKINGVYSSDNTWLLTTVLRDEWNFRGLVVTDWGAMNDRVKAVSAGLDLEMPGGSSGAEIAAAVRNGGLREEDLTTTAERVTALILKAQAARKNGYTYNVDKHHALARRAAAESCVLLKNEEGVLPLKPGAHVALIGSFAKTPRYQGAGSSRINPSRLDNAYDELKKFGFTLSYAEAYRGIEALDEQLIAEAADTARNADIAIVFAGLPDEYESEGFDRTNLAMPASHIRLIETVAKANKHTVVVLQLGAPVLTGWAQDIQGLVISYLGGQAGGGGIADVLSGKVCPGGKLAESWPLVLEDNPSYHFFPGEDKTVEYRESLFIGYRYYDTSGKAAAWPFGFGLSYTSFEYGNLEIKGEEVSFTVTNTGGVAGTEIAQIYAGMPGSKVFRPKKWLAAFEKLRLERGETKTVRVTLGREAFQYYNVPAGRWSVEGGSYTIFAGASVNDIRLTASMNITGDNDVLPSGPKSYFHINGNNFSGADFAALYGRPVPPSSRQSGDPYTINDTLKDIQNTPIGAKLLMKAQKQNEDTIAAMGDESAASMMRAMLMEMPLRTLIGFSAEPLPPHYAEMLVDALNGKSSPELSRLFG